MRPVPDVFHLTATDFPNGEVQMPVVAYSSLGRGLFSGKVRDAQTAKACLDRFSYRGYASEDNFERARRAASLAQKLGVSPAEIALAWLFRRGINVFAVIGTSNAARMRANIAALSLPLTDEECAWLDLGQPQ